MFKSSSLILFFWGVTQLLFAQRGNWDWGRYGTGPQSESGECLTTDGQGNLYVGGSFKSASMSFGQTTVTLTSANAGPHEIFLAKYSSSGSLLWAKSGSGAYDDVITDIAADENGNFYITGYFNSQTLSFGATTLTHGNTGYDEMFLAKFDSSGNAIWAKRYTGTNGSVNGVRGLALELGPDGNVYVAGDFHCYYLQMEGFTLTNHSSATSDLFAAKFDTSGNAIWVKNAGGSLFEMVYDIALSSDGVNIFGTHNSTNFVFGSSTLPSAGSIGYIAKYDLQGNPLWATNVGGVLASPGGDPERVNTIGCDQDGNVFITGVFINSFVIFANDTLFSSLGSGHYLAKYDSNGNALWGKGGPGDPNAMGVSVSPSNVCLTISGDGVDSVKFDGQNYFGLNQVFLCDFNGIVQSNTYVDGSGRIHKVLGNSDGDIFITGAYLFSDMYFSLTQSSPFYSYNGSFDYYAAKMKNTSTGLISEEHSGEDVIIYPNPVSDKISVIAHDILQDNFQIINVNGMVVMEGKMNTNDIFVGELVPGFYFLRLEGGNGAVVIRSFFKQ